jgi:NAD(P)-dependent dehydrogenase (short-subunit alcohol dehydrogenase family)
VSADSIPAVSELFNFSGCRVIVTGGGRGIGQAIALRFAEAGADIAVHYGSSRDDAQATANRIRSMGRRATIHGRDIGDFENVQSLFEEVDRSLGGIDVLVNCAGIYPVRDLVDMTAQEWDMVFDLNVRGVFLCIQAAAKYMRQGGAIVNVSSISGANPVPGQSHYSSSKAAVDMLTQVAASELAPRSIRVNAVAPGLIDREGLVSAWPDGVSRYLSKVPLGRLGTPADVADACLFLVSPAARWITGVVLRVDGGVMSTPIY